MQAQSEEAAPFQNPRWTSWVDLFNTDNPGFLLNCLQAGGTDDEIREWNRLRLAGDPDIESQAEMMAARKPALP